MLAKSSTGLIKQSGKNERAAELACIVCVHEYERHAEFNLLLVINK